MIRMLAVLAATLLCAAASANAQSNRLDWLELGSPRIVPAHAPGVCLNMARGYDGTSIATWECEDGWNQAFRFENARVLGSEGAVVGELTLGTALCLTHQGGTGEYSYVQIEMCRKLPSQVWTMSGGQIIGFDGRCLEVSGGRTGNGIPVHAYPCKSVAHQTWRRSWLPTERRKMAERSGKVSPATGIKAEEAKIPGLAPDYYRGELLAITERERPRISKRALTSDERHEVKALANEFADVKAARAVPYSKLSRLMRLSESGDKEAMQVLMRAFVIVVKRSDGRYDPIDDGGRFARGDTIFARERASKLFGLWAGHMWQLHGPDRNAALGLADCWSAAANCGLIYKWPPKQSGRNLGKWHATGKKDDFLDISDISFFALDGNDAWRQNKFENMLSSLAMAWYGTIQEPTTEGYYWLANYAVTTGQASAYANALSEMQQGKARRYSPEVAKIEQRGRGAAFMDQTGQWHQLLAKATLTEAEQQAFETLSRSLNRLPDYAARYPIRQWASIEDLCRKGLTGYCTEIDAAAAADKARRMAAANFFGNPQAPATVNVRVYDQNGNYQGSRTTTRTEAELLGARPQ